MKFIVLTLICLAAAATAVRAQKTGDVGAGVILGDPIGVTGKYWLSDTRALDAGVGYSDDIAVYGDYLWHGWTVLPQPAQGKLPVYLGLGAQVRAVREAELGLRAVAGVAYWLPHDPVEIFLEIVPVFRLTPDAGADVQGGLGLRYYFKR